ncbi:MAG TPA: EAL domain-containing protein, partial [Rhodanobacteraceae bacterium]|nr:EAL domain-containing protein [Rhodanobacteraceae bacterium]
QYQALLRMRDHEGFVHTAAELLPVARRGGLIPALDRWSLDQGLQLLANHQRQTRPLRLFISQCSESLKERDYPAWLASRLQAHGVRSTRLVLDFRCDDVSDSPRELLHAAPRLKALGVGLSLSGADRSLQTAQLLDAVAFDYLRLAASISANPGALVPIAHARKMAVIAPQIEDESLIQSLRSHGVDFVQGNSLAHPARSLNYSFDGAAASA